jgi:hypothetical protein
MGLIVDRQLEKHQTLAGHFREREEQSAARAWQKADGGDFGQSYSARMRAERYRHRCLMHEAEAIELAWQKREDARKALPQIQEAAIRTPKKSRQRSRGLGYVYASTNPDRPLRLKPGKSSFPPPVRTRGLSSHPWFLHPFEPRFGFAVFEICNAERLMLACLRNYRLPPRRELFEIPVSDAFKLISEALESEIIDIWLAPKG